MLLALEVVFVLCVVVGVALISLPVALVLGGLCGVLACEREQARPTARRGAGS